MLSTVLVEYPWLTTWSLVAIVVAGPLLGAWLVPRRRVTLALTAVVGLVVILLTLVPTDRYLAVGCHVEWSVPTLGKVELVANIILFAPLVTLLGILTRRPLLTLVGASAASALIETIQAVTPALGRSCSTNDWLSNTIGAALGAVLAIIALLIGRKVLERRGAEGSAGAPFR